MWCIVNLPNGTQQAVKWDPKAIGQECLEKVCKALGIICEMEYFGLEHWTPSQKDSRTRQWINLRNRLSFDGSSSGSSIQLMLALRVKFWVPVHFILQESVRNLFYMQAKSDLLEGRLNSRDWLNAAKLIALMCQADGIRFNELSLKSKCPIRMKREQEQLKHQQQQQQHQHQVQQKQEKKDKEYVLSFKKRRLSKQKSIENIDNPQQTLTTATPVPTTVSNTFTVATQHSSSTPSKTSSSTSSSSSLSNSSSNSTLERDCATLEQCMSSSPLRIYQDYNVRPNIDHDTLMPEDFLHQIAVEHGKLATLKMTAKSAKYWLLQELQELPGYGEEVFSGVTTNENSIRCDIAVGAHGITVSTGDEKNNIPFSAIAAAKSFRRTFKLEYLDDHNDRKDLEIKLPKHALAAGLYRSITERHAFYVCDKVRGVVTNQFTRDLKGTIASMFKEDTELGKRYVFDIQRTCREVHDQARRILHERGIEITSQIACGVDDIARFLPRSSVLVGAETGACGSDKAEADINASCSGLSGCSMAGKLDLALREKEEREAAIERCVDTRISEAMTCKICMDRAINTMFNPCCHVMACSQCAARCTNCPNCRFKVTSVVKIYLPPELRTNQSGSTGISKDTNQTVDDDANSTSNNNESAGIASPSMTTPKITAAA